MRIFVTILKNSVPEKLPKNQCLFKKMSNAKQKNNLSKIPKPQKELAERCKIIGSCLNYDEQV
jgi:hypothetical protein